ncbi:phosphate/phosphite/phosphonate ABC transporter substrate-binding protein [Primorskyibacter sp. S187A]|uniref:phosphate/phosphite/phosphonate ABC transporter substrate-binding protein n=1 Tax=Primorskyibacter sp. S187A TaxID=3415130 RepID=UPI003C7E7410
MYWRAENADAWREMWADVQSAGHGYGLDLPDLTPPEEIAGPWTEHWLRDDLILSQTCSMPLRTTLRHQVTYVGTFDFGLGGPPGQYWSHFVTREAGAPIQNLAINGYDSQSGYVAGLEPLVGQADTTAFAHHASDIMVTGSHRASLRAVARNDADGAYIDAVTLKLCDRFDPHLSHVERAGRTPPTPGLPLITAKGTDPEPLRAILRAAFAKGSWRGAPELGGLQDFVVLDAEDYLSLPRPPGPTPH